MIVSLSSIVRCLWFVVSICPRYTEQSGFHTTSAIAYKPCQSMLGTNWEAGLILILTVQLLI